MATGGANEKMVKLSLKMKTGEMQYFYVNQEAADMLKDPDCDPSVRALVIQAALQLDKDVNNNTDVKTNTDDNTNTDINTYTDVNTMTNITSDTVVNSHTERADVTPPVLQKNINNVTSNVPMAIKIWKEEEEKTLIQIRLEADKSFSSLRNHETLWKKITDQMNNIFRQSVTTVQVINKWKNLKTKYKEVTDANNKTGNERVTWKYLDVFDEFYGNKASTKVSCSFDSSRGNSLDEKLSVSKTSDNLPDLSKKRKMPATKTSSKKQAVSDKIDNINKELIDEMKRQHSDRMNRMDRMIAILEKK